MLRIILIALFTLVKFISSAKHTPGNYHTCTTANDCLNLFPPASGCITVKDKGTRCFWVSEIRGKKIADVTFNYLFDN
jgi:hypothetical protein